MNELTYVFDALPTNNQSSSPVRVTCQRTFGMVYQRIFGITAAGNFVSGS